MSKHDGTRSPPYEDTRRVTDILKTGRRLGEVAFKDEHDGPINSGLLRQTENPSQGCRRDTSGILVRGKKAGFPDQLTMATIFDHWGGACHRNICNDILATSIHDASRRTAQCATALSCSIPPNPPRISGGTSPRPGSRGG